MSSVREITATDIAETDPITVNVGQTLSKVRNKMDEANVRTIPVVDGSKFVGMLDYQDVIKKLRSDPSRTEVDDLVHTPPEIDAGDNIVDLASTRINSGRRKFALVGEHDRLEGVIGEHELVFAADDAEELGDTTVDDLMTRDLITVNEDVSHETARSRMMDNKISRLPVLDDDGDYVEVITSTELLRAMVPREQMAEGDLKAHKESLSDIPVSEIINAEDDRTSGTIDDEDMSLREVITKMERDDLREIVVLADGKPAGILTLKDVITYLTGFEPVEGLQVELSGPDVPEEKAVILDKVETAIKGGLGRVLERPEELRIHVKKYEKDGKRHKYSLNFKLSSRLGVTTVKAHGWSLLDAVDEGLNDLETVVKKEKEKRRDQQRQQEREGKYSE